MRWNWWKRRLYTGYRLWVADAERHKLPHNAYTSSLTVLVCAIVIFIYMYCHVILSYRWMDIEIESMVAAQPPLCVCARVFFFSPSIYVGDIHIHLHCICSVIMSANRTWTKIINLTVRVRARRKRKRNGKSKIVCSSDDDDSWIVNTVLAEIRIGCETTIFQILLAGHAQKNSPSKNSIVKEHRFALLLQHIKFCNERLVCTECIFVNANTKKLDRWQAIPMSLRSAEIIAAVSSLHPIYHSTRVWVCVSVHVGRNWIHELWITREEDNTQSWYGAMELCVVATKYKMLYANNWE